VLDDHTYDLHGDMLYRAVDSAYGERIDASAYYNGNDTMVASASDADTLYGLGGNDSIVGGGGANALYGGDGNDTIDGGTGNDALIGGNGDDTYVWHEGGGDDTINSENESDTNTLRLVGVTANEFYMTASTWWYPNQLDIMVYSGGTTNAGSVTIYGENTITSGYEVHTIQLDDVTYDVTAGMLWRGYSLSDGETLRTLDNSGADTVLAGGGADYVYSYGGNDSVDAGAGADTVEAGTGADFVFGGADNDTLYGQDGNDTLDGGTGTDMLYGGNGDDTFIIHSGEGNTNVYDTSGSNVIDLQGAAYTTTNSGDDRTLTLTGTGETVWIDDYNLHTWSVI
jgi:Ca2+-binding RTX toxin-like protein